MRIVSTAICGAVAIAAGVATSSVARALCVLQPPELAFSYPASDSEVPVNPVFWAVPTEGTATATIDGVAMRPLSEEGVGRFQFAPAEPLSVGEHTVRFLVQDSRYTSGSGTRFPSKLIAFHVLARETRESFSEIQIADVTHYQTGATPTPLLIAASEGDCSGQAVSLNVGQCNDVILRTVLSTRLTFSGQGNALGYLVDDKILPASCLSYMPDSWLEAEREYRVEAITPTGLQEPSVFEGTAFYEGEVGNNAEGSSDKGSSCSVAPVGMATGNTERAVGVGLLGLAGLLFSRRRKGSCQVVSNG